MEAEITTQAVGLASATDFTLINLFLRADIVVKSVISILILASIYSWALIFDKYRLFNRIHKSSSIFEDKFWNSKSAEGFYKSLPSKTKDPIANIFRSAMVELIKSKSKNNDIQTARVTRVIEISADKEIQSIEKNFSFLATVGATAPFIGLFGTVWGIMNSFQSIAISTSFPIWCPDFSTASKINSIASEFDFKSGAKPPSSPTLVLSPRFFKTDLTDEKFQLPSGEP